MPIKECTENKKPGWKYGDSGKCYTVEDPGDEKALLEAKKRAIKQAIAIHGSEAHLNEAYRKIAQEIFNTYIKFNYKCKFGTVDESNKCGDSGSEKTLKIGDSILPINKDGTVTLYHRTRPGREASIDKKGLDRMEGGGELYFADSPDRYYPDSPNPVYAVNVSIEEAKEANLYGSHDFVLHKSFGPNEIKKVKN